MFNDRRIRTAWDDKEEKWYFSVVDVIGVLTDSENPTTYWRVLKTRLKKEGNEEGDPKVKDRLKGHLSFL